MVVRFGCCASALSLHRVAAPLLLFHPFTAFQWGSSGRSFCALLFCPSANFFLTEGMQDFLCILFASASWQFREARANSLTCGCCYFYYIESG